MVLHDLRVSSLLWLTSCWIAAVAGSAQCYWPDGSNATDYLPCNPTATQSPCCADGEACLQNGYCFGSYGVTYRGGCTDWSGGTACPDLCAEEVPAGMTLLIFCLQEYAAFWCGNLGVDTPCSTPNGTIVHLPTQFGFDHLVSATSAVTSSTSSAMTTTSLESAKPLALKSSETAAPTPSTTAPAALPKLSTPPSPVNSNGGDHRAGAIGLGLGLGLGIPLIAAVLGLSAYVFVQRRRLAQAKQGYAPPGAEMKQADDITPTLGPQELEDRRNAGITSPRGS